jgi:hypothetical protein
MVISRWHRIMIDTALSFVVTTRLAPLRAFVGVPAAPASAESGGVANGPADGTSDGSRHQHPRHLQHHGNQVSVPGDSFHP